MSAPDGAGNPPTESRGATASNGNTKVKTLSFERAPDSASLARDHVRDELASALAADRLNDAVLLTSEVVSNAILYSRDGAVEVTVVVGATVARVEVCNPGEDWGRGPELRPRGLDEFGGWGLFLVEKLSDRWGKNDAETMVWFEFDANSQVASLDARRFAKER